MFTVSGSTAFFCTACMQVIVAGMQLGVDFREGGNPENPKKNPRSTGEINYDNSIHVSPKYEIQHGAVPRMSPIQSLTPFDRA